MLTSGHTRDADERVRDPHRCLEELYPNSGQDHSLLLSPRLAWVLLEAKKLAHASLAYDTKLYLRWALIRYEFTNLQPTGPNPT